MITLTLSLIFLSFIQTAFTAYDLVFLVLIVRSFIVEDASNYYLAFGVGLLTSLLSGLPLGSLSLIYLLGVALGGMASRTKVSSQTIVLLPLSLVVIIIEQLIKGLYLHFSIDWFTAIINTLLIWPIYLLLIFWEERFIPRKDIKLKLSK